MDALEQHGSLALGSRLKRLSDRLTSDVVDICQDRNSEFEPRWFPLFSLLSQNGQVSVGEAAQLLGVSHASVSQIASRMLACKVITVSKSKDDERRSQLNLTAKGKKLHQTMIPIWKDIQFTVDQVMQEVGTDFLFSIKKIEDALKSESLLSRSRKFALSKEVVIKDYQPQWREWFAKLNIEWIEHFFELEPKDKDVLLNPQDSILKNGGKIYFAFLGENIIGTVALIKINESSVELAKMAVTKKAQGCKAGRALLNHAIAEARYLGASKVYLETNDTLVAAVNMYKSAGFVEVKPEIQSPYKRANLCMELCF